VLGAGGKQPVLTAKVLLEKHGTKAGGDKRGEDGDGELHVGV